MARQALLGRLSEFTSIGETAATRCLVILLEEPALRAATLQWLTQVSGVRFPEEISFFAEQVLEDKSRPDIEGLDSDGRPLVVIEAKFRHQITTRQIESYIRGQVRRLANSVDERENGLTVLLVPESRLNTARASIQEALVNCASEAPNLPKTYAASWSELVRVFLGALENEQSTVDSVKADVHQFHALCQTLERSMISFLDFASAGGSSREQLPHYRAISNKVTRALSSGKLSPIGDDPDFLARRYFPSGLPVAEGEESSASFGIQSTFADKGRGPLWIRFNRSTGGFQKIVAIIGSSSYQGQVNRHHGHLWLPLTVNSDLGEPELIDDLVAQVRAIQEVLSRKI